VDTSKTSVILHSKKGRNKPNANCLGDRGAIGERKEKSSGRRWGGLEGEKISETALPEGDH